MCTKLEVNVANVISFVNSESFAAEMLQNIPYTTGFQGCTTKRYARTRINHRMLYQNPMRLTAVRIRHSNICFIVFGPLLSS